MNSAFSLIGKIVLVLGVIGTIAAGAFFWGKNSGTKPVEPPVSATSTQEPLPTLLPVSPSPTGTITPASNPKKIVSAGLSAKSGLSYTTYTIDVPDGWTHTLQHDEKIATDRLTIQKGSYELRIFQGATGGAMCLYPGDPAVEGPQSAFDTFTAITTADGIALRRGGTSALGPDGKRGFTVCQKAPDSTYQQPTVFGHTSYMGPGNFEGTVLDEMDAMIASLKKTP